MGKTRGSSNQPAIFLGADGRVLPRLSGAVFLFSPHGQHSCRSPASPAPRGAAAPGPQAASSSGALNTERAGCGQAAAANLPSDPLPVALAADPAADGQACSAPVSDSAVEQGMCSGGAPSSDLHPEAAEDAAAAAATAPAPGLAPVEAEVHRLREQLQATVAAAPCRTAPLDWLSCIMAELSAMGAALRALAGGPVLLPEEEVQQLVGEVVQDALAAYGAGQPPACTTSAAEQQLYSALLLAEYPPLCKVWEGQHLPVHPPAASTALTQQDLVSLFGDSQRCSQQAGPAHGHGQVAPTVAAMAACVEVIRAQLALYLAPATCPVVLPAGLLGAWAAQKHLPVTQQVAWLQQQGAAAGLGGATALSSRVLTLAPCCSSQQWTVLAIDLQEGWAVQLVAHQHPSCGVHCCTAERPGADGTTNCGEQYSTADGGPGWSPQLNALSELVAAMLEACGQPAMQPRLTAVLCPQELPQGCAAPAQLTGVWALTALVALAGGWPPQVELSTLAQCGPVKWAANLVTQQLLPFDSLAGSLVAAGLA